MYPSSHPQAPPPPPPERKRSRSEQQPPQSKDATLAAHMRTNPGVTLNYLLQKTHEQDYSSSSLELEGDLVLVELVRLFYEAVQWTPPSSNDEVVPVFSSAEAWTQAPTPQQQAWIDHCRLYLGGGKMSYRINDLYKERLSVIVMILRNLSFKAANLKLLSYSPEIVSILTGCLYETFTVSSRSTLAVHALPALVHMAPYMDVNGHRLVSDVLFYAPHHRDGPRMPISTQAFGLTQGGTWGMAGLKLAKRLDPKEDNMEHIQKKLLYTLATPYLVAVWGLFGGLAHCLTDPQAPRGVLLGALDLWHEVVSGARVGVVGAVQYEDKEGEIPGLRAILVQLPDAMVERLGECLYLPRHGPHAPDYVSALKSGSLKQPYSRVYPDATSAIDAEVRDKTLNTLVPLLELDSPRMAQRLGCHPSTGEVRPQIMDAVVQCMMLRNTTASAQACDLWRELSKAPENDESILYWKDVLVEMASRDHRTTQVLWNHVNLDLDEDEEEDEGADTVMAEA